MIQAGPRRLWDEIEELHHRWSAAGRPGRDRWTVDVDPVGSTTLRLDERPGPAGSARERTAAVLGTGGT